MSAVCCLAVVLAACRQTPAPPAATDGAGDAVPAMAESPRPSARVGDLTVELVRVQRLHGDLVEAEFLASNGGPSPLDLQRLLSSGAGGLEDAAFVDSSGDVRTFVVHDEHNAPQCSTLGVLAAAGRATFFVRFAALSEKEYQGTIRIPGLPPLADVTVPRSPGT